MGPVDLTNNTLSPAESELIPTVTDNLFDQGKISAHEVAISFEPEELFASGELTFGGVDTGRFEGSITYTPISTSDYHFYVNH